MSPDIAKEFNKFDSDPNKYIKKYNGVNAVTKKPFAIDVGYERFLGPEIFFHPEVRGHFVFVNFQGFKCVSFTVQKIFCYFLCTYSTK